MQLFDQSAREALRHPARFWLAVIRQFRANQGLLLAGAVAYYALLSLVPLLILVVLALTHVFDEARVLATVGASLEFVVPGRSDALVDELRAFLTHRDVVGWLLVALMLFFSSLAFTVLENAMSVIFFHRVAVRRRHFLDEPRRDRLARRVLALSGFHLVAHEHPHGGLVTGGLGADAHRVCHDLSP